MTLKPHLLVVACSLLASVSACFDDKGPGAEGSVTELCNESYARRATIATAQCQCQVDQGTATDVETCLAASGGATASAACACEVQGAVPEARAGLECAAPAQEAALACIKDLSCTQGASAFDACINTFYNDISTCAAPPRQVVSEVALQCEMVPPLVCGSGETIPETWKCDQKPDCMDASDEMECAGIFVCKDGKGSIEEELTCDGFPDCADKSDETSCPTFTCTGNGTVILLSFRCDGFPDCCPDSEMECVDQSDEQNCPTFMCDGGVTHPLAFKCDGVPDCDDMTDEANCTSP